MDVLWSLPDWVGIPNISIAMTALTLTFNFLSLHFNVGIESCTSVRREEIFWKEYIKPNQIKNNLISAYIYDINFTHVMYCDFHATYVHKNLNKHTKIHIHKGNTNINYYNITPCI